ncbi:MAG: pyrroline-5-carboxylate reductase [Clostridia bacterium]|nr:pyrroline-5-carboxylate reductase [Clostridia bacterium]
MSYKYGFIGSGNMSSALVSALVSKVEPQAIALSNRTAVKVETLSKATGAVVSTNEEIAKSAKYVVLGVKPQMLETVLEPLKGELKANENPILVTMAAGTKIKTICEMAGGDYPVIRIMPNTPVAVGAGVILISRNSLVSDEDFETFIGDFEKAGVIVRVEEDMIDAGSVISGCGPAYVYMFIDAMAKAGESLGLSYETAATLAKATARGAALLSETKDESLENLRIAVCSPGGSTIEGVKSFFESDLDDVVSKALTAAYKRTKELGGE